MNRSRDKEYSGVRLAGKPYPVSIRALSFERLFSMCDPDYNRPAGNTHAIALRHMFGRDAQSGH